MIGIDAGRDTGIAIYDRDKKRILELKLLDFWATVELLENFHIYIKGEQDILFPSDDYEVEMEVVIEDPNLNKPVFVDKSMEFRVALDKAQKVGRVKEQSYLLIDYLIRKKIKHRVSKPSSSKWDAKVFNQITKWQGSSNEHTRDAGKLVFGL